MRTRSTNLAAHCAPISSKKPAEVRPHTMEVAAILLSALSIAVALYAPRIISFIRALYILRNVPSPPSSGLLSGHASDLTTLKR